MTFGDLDQLFRIFTAEPDNQGRWADSDVATLVNEAQNFIALQVEFPKYHWTQPSVNGQQEYTLPPLLYLHRVYLAGQACVPTDIETMEGIQIEFYDQTNPNGIGTPNWNAQTATTYPVVNTMSGFPMGVSPFTIGMRPQYYLNGGNIGFIPPPNGAFNIDLWGIGVPLQLVNQADVCVFPLFYKSAIAWKAAELAFLSDSQPEKAQMALMKFNEQMIEIRQQVRGMQKYRSRGPRPITYRHFYRRGAILADPDSTSGGKNG